MDGIGWEILRFIDAQSVGIDSMPSPGLLDGVHCLIGLGLFTMGRFIKDDVRDAEGTLIVNDVQGEVGFEIECGQDLFLCVYGPLHEFAVEWQCG